MSDMVKQMMRPRAVDRLNEKIADFCLRARSMHVQVFAEEYRRARDGGFEGEKAAEVAMLASVDAHGYITKVYDAAAKLETRKVEEEYG